MAQQAEGFAPGKLILAGEHAVVYGYPALALAVNRGTTVTARRRPGASALAAASWRDASGAERPFPPDPRLQAAIAAVLPPQGVEVQVRSTLPPGRGMGSSAALAIALVRALAALEERPLDFDVCHAEGFKVERVFHGNPSGLDHAVATLGGSLAYRRLEGGRLSLERCPAPPLKLVVLDSGSAGDTAAMVAGVAARRPEVDPVLAEIGLLVAELRATLGGSPEGSRVGPLLTQNHRLLQRIGVSTPALDGLVALALGAGAAGAKLAGAGGGGVVLALTDDPEALLQAAHARGVVAFPAEVHPAAPLPCPAEATA